MAERALVVIPTYNEAINLPQIVPLVLSQDPRLEVLNFGVGGYGTDQAFLRYQRDGIQFQPEIVLLGIMPENIYRLVNRFRPFYLAQSGIPLTKPRYVLRSGKLVLLENPMRSIGEYRQLLSNPAEILPRLGDGDYYFENKYRSGALDFLGSIRLAKVVWYEFQENAQGSIVRHGAYHEAGDAFQILCSIADEFAQFATRHGSKPVILILPERIDLSREIRGSDRRYAPLLSHLRARGYSWLDLSPSLVQAAKAQGLSDVIDGHYTPFGNEVVAKSIHDYLADQGWLN